VLLTIAEVIISIPKIFAIFQKLTAQVMALIEEGQRHATMKTIARATAATKNSTTRKEKIDALKIWSKLHI